MAAKDEKWYLIIPSKGIIQEWNGTVYNIVNTKETTPRGAVYEYIWARTVPNEKALKNIFVQGITNAKKVSKYILSKYKLNKK